MMTGVEVANLTNEVLKRQGVDKTIPAQMIYNYMKSGKIAFEVVDGGKKRVEEKIAFEWIKTYVSGVGAKKQTTEANLAAFDEYEGGE